MSFVADAAPTQTGGAAQVVTGEAGRVVRYHARAPFHAERLHALLTARYALGNGAPPEEPTATSSSGAPLADVQHAHGLVWIAGYKGCVEWQAHKATMCLKPLGPWLADRQAGDWPPEGSYERASFLVLCLPSCGDRCVVPSMHLSIVLPTRALSFSRRWNTCAKGR